MVLVVKSVLTNKVVHLIRQFFCKRNENKVTGGRDEGVGGGGGLQV